MIWGRVIGAFLGLMFLKGLIGLLIGFYIGRQFDIGYLKQHGTHQRTQSQRAFFEITFAVMGHLAKADGVISTQEIRLAQETMRLFQLDNDAKKEAIAAFNRGKDSSFDLGDAIRNLKRHIGLNLHLYQLFYDIQEKIARIDGHASPKKRQKLAMIQSMLFGQSHRQSSYRHHHYQYQQRAQQVSSSHDVDQAYALLGVNKRTPFADVKKAYKKLMLKNHPDRLMSQGLPEEMLRLAKEKTQAIKAAYDTIKAVHST